MNEIADAELIEIGRKAAGLVDGLGRVEDVKVRVGQNSTDQPAYFFSFLIDRDRDREQAGLTRIRLIQKLRDELVARHDEHYPIVQVLNRTDWEKRESA